MANWACLVKEAVKAEVPDFEMLRTMASFLEMVNANHSGDLIIKRMAVFFKCPQESRLDISIAPLIVHASLILGNKIKNDKLNCQSIETIISEFWLRDSVFLLYFCCLNLLI